MGVSELLQSKLHFSLVMELFSFARNIPMVNCFHIYGCKILNIKKVNSLPFL